MDGLVTLAFVNRDSGQTSEMSVHRDATRDVARWYGGYHAGDDYDVLIDGAVVAKNVNGEI